MSASTTDDQRGLVERHPVLAYGGGVVFVLGVANGVANAAFKLGPIASLAISVAIVAGALAVSVSEGERRGQRIRTLLREKHSCDEANAALEQDNTALRQSPPTRGGQQALYLHQIDRITSMHECAYTERREITYWIEGDGQDRVDIVYHTAPPDALAGNPVPPVRTGEDETTSGLIDNSADVKIYAQLVHWRRLWVGARGDVQILSSFDDIKFKVSSDDPATEVLFFPTVERPNLLEGVVFFKPPLSRELTWGIAYEWNGLWNDLRRPPEHRGLGRQRGTDKSQCQLAKVQTDFVLPRDATEPFLQVGSRLAGRARSSWERTTKKDRPAVRWVLENSSEHVPYELTAKFPA